MINVKNQGKLCSVSGCDRPSSCRGMCSKHYQQVRLRGSIIEKTGGMLIAGVCKILGCGKKPQARGLCPAHYRQERVKEAAGRVLVNGVWVAASKEFTKIVEGIKT